MIDPLQSRCQVLKIVPPSKNEVAKHILRILEQEEIQYEAQDVKALVQRCYPDLRKMLNLVQSSTVDGVLTLDKDVIVQNNYMLSILKELSTGKNYTALRQILADSGVKEYEELYRYLFDNATKFAPGKEGSIAVILNTHLYQANFRIDKEINMASCLSQILETI
jgi:DNA polymerase III delta prime subunit